MPPSSGGTLGSTDQINDHLSRYVRDYLRTTDTSERALAAKCRDPQTGLPLRHGWINQVINGAVERAPELWRLRALAAGIGVPVRVLAELAAAQWLGLETVEVSTGRESSVVIPVPEGLSEAQLQRFRRMAEDMARHLVD